MGSIANNSSISSLVNLFSINIIKEIANTNKSQKAIKIIEETHNLSLLDHNETLFDFFDRVYDLLFKNYRSEYCYKNTIVRRHLLGKHSLKTSFVLTEFRAGNCKADLVLLNGTSTVYEIKSEFDSPARLQRQLTAYKKVFDRINIITTRNFYEKVKDTIEDHVGIMILKDNEYISDLKKSKSIKHNLSPEDIFNTLKREEYLTINRKYFGRIPKVPNTQIYKVSKELFCQLSPEVAHDEMVNTLKIRGNSTELKSFINDSPNSLKAISISQQLSDKERKKFTCLLNKKVHDILY